eukprot:CAMPEP_0174261774 /NCGR_PEP_ID=MMETSP0439-20130205/12147_1 /TAXON_ID=0 /ORGANISM="Stereomyxa ramosa, Strain Chinc5" /LENGTH=184 /DNA_ID=CAMNT_0015346337 /DNA_START=368 /DNA_END=922 /DNA_ORIENTATION=+
MAAKHEKEIAELFEKDGDIAGAMQHYERSADFWEGENSKSAAKNCWLKVAAFSADMEDFERAIEIYERIGFESADGGLSQWSAKDYFLSAGLCRLATGDLVGVQQALGKYKDALNSFPREKQCKFLEQLINALEQYDVEAYTEAVREYDDIIRLNEWQTKILLRIKKSVGSPDATEETPASILV